MRLFQTISQILVAASIVNCVLAAPSAEQETHDARADMSQLERRFTLSDTAKTIFKTAPFAGMVAGIVGALSIETQKYIAAAIPANNGRDIPVHSRSVTEPGNDAISRSLVGLSDEDLRLLSVLSRRAIESLD